MLATYELFYPPEWGCFTCKLQYLKTSLTYVRILLLLFEMGPKRVSNTEKRTQTIVLDNRIVREYLEIRRDKKRKSWVKTQ
jgi:hypothetical protein